MSRIHEALKRAEQEKAGGWENATPEPYVAAVGEIVEEARRSISESEGAKVVAAIDEEVRVGSLGYEDVRAKCSRREWKPDPKFLVFSNANPFHAGSEQFRTLRSRLYRMRESQPLQTILISSAIPAEGKTLVATNLAHAMVRQQGCRVLLIDADFRSPRVHILLGAPGTPGLADYLQNGADELEVIQRGQEEGFCFVPAGKHVTHPSELISSERMKQFLERVKPAFDWVIIDSPPALPVADASVLGGLCDGALLVVRANSTPAEASQKACKELQDAHLLGVVLNTVKEDSQYGSYYANSVYGLVHFGGAHG
jgi:protein-tyrosine kinase